MKPFQKTVTLSTRPPTMPNDISMVNLILKNHFLFLKLYSCNFIVLAFAEPMQNTRKLNAMSMMRALINLRRY